MAGLMHGTGKLTILEKRHISQCLSNCNILPARQSPTWSSELQVCFFRVLGLHFQPMYSSSSSRRRSSRPCEREAAMWSTFHDVRLVFECNDILQSDLPRASVADSPTTHLAPNLRWIYCLNWVHRCKQRSDWRNRYLSNADSMKFDIQRA